MELLDGPNTALLADARKYFPLPWTPHISKDLAEIDKITLAEAIDNLNLTPDIHSLVRSFWMLNFNGKLDEAAYTQALRWAATANGSWQLMLEICGSYKIRGGTLRLAGAILADSRAELKLSHPVESLEHDTAGVKVRTTNGAEFAAKRLVLAVPLHVVSSLDVQPPLSPVKQRAAQQGHAGRGVKLWIKVRGAQEPFMAFGADDDVFNMVQSEILEDDHAVLIGFGSDASAIDVDDVEAVQRAVDEVVPGLEVLEVTSHNWMEDEYAKSTWSMHYTGYLTESLEELQRADGVIQLAGSDLASGWGGFIDGAIESGLNVARLIQGGLAFTDTAHMPSAVTAKL